MKLILLKVLISQLYNKMNIKRANTIIKMKYRRLCGKPEILYKRGGMTMFMPPYHIELDTLWNKIKSDGEKYKYEDMKKYEDMYEDIKKRERWELMIYEADLIQNDAQYFKDNPDRLCLKCNQIVTAGGNNCLRTQEERPTKNSSYEYDSTKTAYYSGDKAAAVYQEMFTDLFNLCLAKYPRGDTMRYKNAFNFLN